MDDFKTEGQEVMIYGNLHKLKFDGEVSKMSVIADNCEIYVGSVGSIVVKGTKNKIIYRTGSESEEPTIMTRPGNNIVKENW